MDFLVWVQVPLKRLELNHILFTSDVKEKKMEIKQTKTNKKLYFEVRNKFEILEK